MTFRKRKPRSAKPPKAAPHVGRKSFVEFCRKCGPVLDPDFRVTEQIKYFAFLVEPAIVESKGWLRLILVWPPGTGKTWCGVLFEAWCFGIHPRWHQLELCLSADFASDIGQMIKRVIESTEYAEVFPDVSIPRDASGKKHFEIVDRGATGRGEFNAVGRSTRFTGRRGRLLDIDDLLAEKEADSEVALDDCKRTIRAMRSRGHPAGFHWVVRNTRYREDDPIGHILAKYKSLGPWIVVVLPTVVEQEDIDEQRLLSVADHRRPGQPSSASDADVVTEAAGADDADETECHAKPPAAPANELVVYEHWRRLLGDVLFPYSENPKDLWALKSDYYSDGKQHEWYGQHKGKPRPPEGRKVNLAWFRRYAESPRDVWRRCDRVTVSVDTANKDKQANDFTAILVWGEQGARKYLLWMSLGKWVFDVMLVELAKVCLDWQPHRCLLEEAGNGLAAAQYLPKYRGVKELASDGTTLRELPWTTPIEGVIPANDMSKELRFDANAVPTIKQGDVWLPVEAAWLPRFEEAVSNFPRTVYKDICDATGQFLGWARDHSPGADAGNDDPLPEHLRQTLAPLGGIHVGIHGGDYDGGENFLTRW